MDGRLGTPASTLATSGTPAVSAADGVVPRLPPAIGCPSEDFGSALAVLPVLLLLVGALFLLDGGLEDVAERGARVGGAVLRHGLLLLRDLQRLDRHRDAAAMLVEADDRGVHLVAHIEALGPLRGAVAGQIGTLD